MMTLRTMIVGCSLTLAIGPAAWGQTASAKVAQRLSAILDPAGKSGGVLSAPKPRVGPAKVERPEAALPLADETPPLVPLPAGKPLRPRLSPEPSPLFAYMGEPVAPRPVTFMTGPLVKQIAASSNAPMPLPILGAFARDRISVADPSMEASAVLILREQKPERANPVPFSAWNLPDPFENATVIRLREPWPDAQMPPVFVVPPSGR